MSVRVDLGISEDEWETLEKVSREDLIRKQAKTELNRQLQWQAVIEDDDRDIRRRTRAAHKSILGQDTHGCVDKPLDMEDCEDDVRITILGDVVGDKAAQLIADSKKKVELPPIVDPPPPQPPPQPGSKWPWWWRMLAALLGLMLAAMLAMLIVLLTRPSPTYEASIEYDAQAVSKAIREVEIPQ